MQRGGVTPAGMAARRQYLLGLAMSTPGIAAEEFPCDILTPFYYEQDILAEPLPIIAGEARPLEKPGLGVELDEQKIEKYRVK